MLPFVSQPVCPYVCPFVVCLSDVRLSLVRFRCNFKVCMHAQDSILKHQMCSKMSYMYLYMYRILLHLGLWLQPWVPADTSVHWTRYTFDPKLFTLNESIYMSIIAAEREEINWENLQAFTAKGLLNCQLQICRHVLRGGVPHPWVDGPQGVHHRGGLQPARPAPQVGRQSVGYSFMAR